MMMEKEPDSFENSAEEPAGKEETLKPEVRETPQEKKIEIGKLRGELEELARDVEEEKDGLVRAMRLPKKYETAPVPIAPEDRALIDATSDNARELLVKHHHEGFGIFPSADPESNYFNQVWARDSAHAGGNFFASSKPEAAHDALATIFKHQKEDGSLPSRVEREYQAVRFTPGLRKWSRQIFGLIEGKIKGRNERPVFEGQDFAGGEDTIPAILIAAGEFYIASDKGKEFGQEHFEQLKKAAQFFRGKTDPRDHLAVMTRSNPDWADTITRKGKMGTINIWWARGLRLLEHIASRTGHKEDAEVFKNEFHAVRASIMEQLYDPEEGFFRDEAESGRLDTVASVFGALYLLSPEQAVKLEEALKRRVERPSGLQNFDPPYPKEATFWAHRLMGQWKYHNEYVWPWVTAQNIQVKVKIALQHPDHATRDQYKKEAIEDLVKVAKLFEKAGGAYEVFLPDRPEKASTAFYTPPKNFMGSLAAYEGAYAQLKELGWI